MAITFVGATTGLTNSLTEPAHSAGDILFVVANRDGSNTAPGTPTGYTVIDSNITNSVGSAVFYRVGDGVSGTITSANATSIDCAAYRGADGTTPIGAHAFTTAVSTTVTWPALALTNTSGSSWVILFGVTRNDGTVATLETPPAGFTNRADSADTTDEAVIHDSNGGLASFAGASQAIGGSSTGNVGFAVELIAAASAGGGTPVSASGSAAGAASVSGAANALVTASGTSGGRSGATGSSNTIVSATGTAAGTATVSGSTSSNGSSGTAAGTSTVVGSSNTIISAKGTVSGRSFATGEASDAGAVVVPPAAQPDGDAFGSSQFRAKRSKREDDPRSAIERLIDRFKAAHAKPQKQAPKAIAAAVAAADEVKEEIAEAFAPDIEPVVRVRWDAALEELRQATEREAQAHALLQAIEALKAIQQKAREADNDEEEALMLLVAA